MAAIPATVRKHANRMLLDKINKRALFHRIDLNPKLEKSRFVYFDGSQLEELRPSKYVYDE